MRIFKRFSEAFGGKKGDAPRAGGPVPSAPGAAPSGANPVSSAPRAPVVDMNDDGDLTIGEKKYVFLDTLEAYAANVARKQPCCLQVAADDMMDLHVKTLRAVQDAGGKHELDYNLMQHVAIVCMACQAVMPQMVAFQLVMSQAKTTGGAPLISNMPRGKTCPRCGRSSWIIAYHPSGGTPA